MVLLSEEWKKGRLSWVIVIGGISQHSNNLRSYSSVKHFNPLTPTGDQDRISLYNINTIIGKQAMRIKKKQLDGYLLIQYQILRTNIARIILQIVGRISNEMLGVKGLSL